MFLAAVLLLLSVKTWEIFRHFFLQFHKATESPYLLLCLFSSQLLVKAFDLLPIFSRLRRQRKKTKKERKNKQTAIKQQQKQQQQQK